MIYNLHFDNSEFRYLFFYLIPLQKCSLCEGILIDRSACAKCSLVVDYQIYTLSFTFQEEDFLLKVFGFLLWGWCFVVASVFEVSGAMSFATARFGWWFGTLDCHFIIFGIVVAKGFDFGWQVTASGSFKKGPCSILIILLI